MTTYNRYSQLLGKTLKIGDHLTFSCDHTELNYKVNYRYLNNISFGDNALIFEKLGENKLKFCTEAFGYEARRGDCPTCDDEDYKALTRLALAIFRKCKNFDSGYSDIIKGLMNNG